MNLQSEGVAMVDDMSPEKLDHATNMLANEFVDGSNSAHVYQRKSGMDSVMSYQPGASLGRAKRNPWIGKVESNAPDTLREFVVGNMCIGDLRNANGQSGRRIYSDDHGTLGAGTFGTNEPITTSCVLEPNAYGLNYNEADIESVLPMQSLVWMLSPDDDSHRTTCVLHTLQTLNVFLRSKRKDKDVCCRDGIEFSKRWLFCGSLLHLDLNGSFSSRGGITATTVGQGPATIKNVFGATGYSLSVGFRLYVLLRKITHPEGNIYKDSRRVDAREYRSETSVACDGGFWQLVPYACRDDQPPPSIMYTGPGWTGTYYYIGMVQRGDHTKANPRQFENNVNTAIYPNKNYDAVSSLESFRRLHTLDIALGL